MLRNLKDLRGYAIRASDGVIGKVDDFYFDDETWAIRYLVVDTGAWLSGRKVLISPIALGHAGWMGRQLPVALTRAQVERSPDIDTRKPVSRQHEAQYFGYYGYPYYWGGAGLWGMGAYPGSLTAQGRIEEDVKAHASQATPKPDDCHLRSSNAVIGHHINATDGEIGHLEDLLVDDHTWAIRHLIVNTSNWWGGQRVLLAPHSIKDVSWSEAPHRTGGRGTAAAPPASSPSRRRCWSRILRAPSTWASTTPAAFDGFGEIQRTFRSGVGAIRLLGEQCASLDEYPGVLT